jgi:hypothetical protein
MTLYDENQVKGGHLNAKPDETGESVCKRCPNDYVLRSSLTGLLCGTSGCVRVADEGGGEV